MTDHYFYSLLSFFLFIPVVVFVRLVEKNWHSPSVIFSFLWFAVIGFSLLSAPDYYFSPEAICFVIAMVSLFFLGGWLPGKISSPRKESALFPNTDNVSQRRFLNFIYISLVCGFISIGFLLKDSSFSLTNISKEKLFQIASQFTRERYSGVRLSQLTMFFLMINYSGCMAAGYLAALGKTIRQRLFAFIVFLPLLIFTFIYTARATLLFGIILFAGTFLAAINGKEKVQRTGTNKLALLSIVLFVVFIPVIFLLTQASRMGIEKLTLNNVEYLMNYIRVWFAGNISAFSFWYDSYQAQSLGMGQFTFAGIFELLNLHTRQLGIYSMAYDANDRMIFTNIYTFLRFLVDDFGLLGASVFVFGLGYVSKKLSTNISGRSLISTALLGGILSFLLFSFITSVWAYNTVLFAWMIFVFACLLIEKQYASR